jgi:hypothetical protein
MAHCEDHYSVMENLSRVAADLHVTTSNLKTLSDNVTRHHSESEREGGHRDRIAKIEILADLADRERKQIRGDMWKTGLFSGIIGGLIGKLTPELIDTLTKFLLKVG